MKQIGIYVLFFMLLSIVTGCEKEPDLPPPPPVEEKKAVEVEWITAIDTAVGSIINLNHGKVWKDLFLLGGDKDFDPTLYAWDTKTGKQVWKYEYSGRLKHDFARCTIVEDHIYVGVTNDGILAIDLNTQKKLWEIDFYSPDYGRGFEIYYRNGKLYHLPYTYSKPTVFELWEIDPHTGSYEVLYKSMYPYSPVSFVNDDVIVFNEYPNPSDQSPPKYMQSILAYDLKQEEELWRVDSFTNYGTNGNLFLPIDDGIVYTGGAYRMYAFDVETGEQKWVTPIPGNEKHSIFYTTEHLIHEDRLYVNEVGENLTCLDKKTGEIIWNSTKASNCTLRMVYYKDMLVMTSWGHGSVLVFDALTGEQLGKLGPIGGVPFDGDPVYDESTDMFFASTYRHAVAFKVQDPRK